MKETDSCGRKQVIKRQIGDHELQWWKEGHVMRLTW